MIKAVLFDMIGTNVSSTTPDFIIDCFKKAFTEYGIEADEERLRNGRGKDKTTMINEVLIKHKHSNALASSILQSFNNIVNNSVNSFTEMESTVLDRAYLKICLMLFTIISVGTNIILTTSELLKCWAEAGLTPQ